MHAQRCGGARIALVELERRGGGDAKSGWKRLEESSSGSGDGDGCGEGIAGLEGNGKQEE